MVRVICGDGSVAESQGSSGGRCREVVGPYGSGPLHLSLVVIEETYVLQTQ